MVVNLTVKSELEVLKAANVKTFFGLWRSVLWCLDTDLYNNILISILKWVLGQFSCNWDFLVSNITAVNLPSSSQGRIKLFGAPRQWKHFRPLFQAVFLSVVGGYYPPDSQTPRLPVPRQK